MIVVAVTLEIPSLPMTPEEFDALPDVEGVRFELVEGNLLIMNAAYVPWHGKMIHDLISWFSDQNRPAFSECGVRAGKNRRTCDVGVFVEAPALQGSATHDATAFAIVIEVVSDESYQRDHFDKPREYASAGIPAYWIVDLHPSDETDGVVSMFHLELTDDGPRYQLRQQTSVRDLISGS